VQHPPYPHWTAVGEGARPNSTHWLSLAPLSLKLARGPNEDVYNKGYNQSSYFLYPSRDVPGAGKGAEGVA